MPIGYTLFSTQKQPVNFNRIYAVLLHAVEFIIANFPPGVKGNFV